MLPALLIPAILAGASALGKAGLGASQLINANKLSKRYQRPTMEIPSAIGEAVGIGRNLAQTGLPGYNQIQDKLSGNLSSGINAIRNTGLGGAEKLAAMTSLYGQNNQTINDLGIANSAQKVSNQMSLEGLLQTLGQYQNQAWDYNKNQPYQNAMSAASALNNAGTMNIYGGLNDVGQLGSSLALGGGMGGTPTLDAISKFAPDLSYMGNTGELSQTNYYSPDKKPYYAPYDFEFQAPYRR